MNALFCFFTIIVVVSNREVNSLEIDPCKVYPLSKQIVCDGAIGLNPQKLHDIGQLITGPWEYLIINSTPLEKILPETFKNAEFTKIFITSNEHLTEISDTAFKPTGATKSLIIRNNKILSDHVKLFSIALKLGSNLKYLEYDGNAIAQIPNNALNDINKTAFQKLEYIRLDNQQGTKLASIGDHAFANLPLLRQLSLDNNNIITIGTGGIDLKGSSLLSTEHIIVFLNNNKLPDIQIDETKIILPEDGKASVGLVLENNKIENLTSKLADIIFNILKSTDGKVFLKSTPPIKCDCVNVKKLIPIYKLPAKKAQIYGFAGSCGTPEVSLDICTP